MALRVTKEAGEVLRSADPAPNLRATKVSAEVLRSVTTTTALRATKVSAEVLRSVALAPTNGGARIICVIT